MRFSIFLVLFSLSVFFTLPYEGSAESNPIACYDIEVDVPDTDANVSSTPHAEVWCYKNLESSPPGSVLVFNADTLDVKPELAAIVEADGLVTHGSLLKGEVTLHQVHKQSFNPLGVPLDEPVAEPQNRMIHENREELEAAAKRLLDYFSASVETLDVEPVAFDIRPGTFRESVPQQAKPWRGSWWPRKGHPLSGSDNSPLAKYDRFVRARGASSHAASWENSHHDYDGVGWEGHCNGWAASAVLRSEPRTSKRDSRTGILFSVSDQKGILAEMDYCARVAFYGRRNYGRGDKYDIYPDEFHKTLTYYIGHLNKPVNVDYNRRSPVFNHVISGYRMEIRSLGGNRYSVKAVINMHRYDKGRTNKPGMAPQYTRTYRYTLRTNSQGEPISGTWHTTNPDFFWVPLGVQDCSRNNPHLTERWTREIIY